MFFFRSEPLWGPPIKAFLTWQLGNILQRSIFNFPAVFLFSFNFVQLFVTGRNLDWRRTSTSIGWSKALHSHFRVRISANISEGRSIIRFLGVSMEIWNRFGSACSRRDPWRFYHALVALTNPVFTVVFKWLFWAHHTDGKRILHSKWNIECLESLSLFSWLTWWPPIWGQP